MGDVKTSTPVRLPRFFRSAVLLAAVFFGSSGIALADTRWATLEAIHQLENPRNLTRPGKHGELGAYQFRPATWRLHTKIPFSQALKRDVSDQVAVLHYEWLKRGLERADVPATPYNIALAWNSGLDAVTLGRSPRVAHDYATRAATLASAIAKTAREREKAVAESRLLASAQ